MKMDIALILSFKHIVSKGGGGRDLLMSESHKLKTTTLFLSIAQQPLCW